MAYLLYQICQKICQKPAKPENVPNHHVQWTRCKLFSICFGWNSINTKVQGISNTQFYYVIFHLRKKSEWWKEWLHVNGLVACVAIFSSLVDASMTPPPPLYPLPPTPRPPHAARRGKWEARGPSVWFTVWCNMMLALIAKKLLEIERRLSRWWMNEYRWCCSIIPIQDCLKVAWRQMSPQWFTRQGKIIRRCKQSRSSAKLIYTSYPPSFSTIHLKWFQTTIKY